MMRLLIALLLLVSTACTTQTTAPATPVAVRVAGPGAVATLTSFSATPPPDPRTITVPPSGSCHAQNGLPDRACTPGVLNASVTTAQLCSAGFTTKSIRPPVSYTDPLKIRLMDSYGYAGQSPAGFELDHLVPLEDGGHPWAVGNLWPQARTGEPNAGEKDIVENEVKKEICANPIQAPTLQFMLATNWPQLRRAAVVNGSPVPTVEPEP